MALNKASASLLETDYRKEIEEYVRGYFWDISETPTFHAQQLLEQRMVQAYIKGASNKWIFVKD